MLVPELRTELVDGLLVQAYPNHLPVVGEVDDAGARLSPEASQPLDLPVLEQLQRGSGVLIVNLRAPPFHVLEVGAVHVGHVIEHHVGAAALGSHRDAVLGLARHVIAERAQIGLGRGDEHEEIRAPEREQLEVVLLLERRVSAYRVHRHARRSAHSHRRLAFAGQRQPRRGTGGRHRDVRVGDGPAQGFAKPFRLHLQRAARGRTHHRNVPLRERTHAQRQHSRHNQGREQRFPVHSDTSSGLSIAPVYLICRGTSTTSRARKDELWTRTIPARIGWTNGWGCVNTRRLIFSVRRTDRWHESVF